MAGCPPLQWSPDQTAGETTQLVMAWIYYDELQWSPDQTAGETSSGCATRAPRGGFNGAPTKRPGKRRRGARSGHGRARLQWSPDQTAGETSVYPRALPAFSELQWSPDQTAGETPIEVAEGRRPRGASMEPRPNGRG